ncbi:hypothetical protein ROA7745_00882 [Roseovarius aestuarii]|uniref:Uncharacterized protein n=1 Tax=Roseovarius aestuarii TaxID=475083 RepID=A0A1X7BN78_9RHOB|nr:hypothetical protein ROA7745_00882 [Roseovarius aestuarii]
MEALGREVASAVLSVHIKPDNRQLRTGGLVVGRRGIKKAPLPGQGAFLDFRLSGSGFLCRARCLLLRLGASLGI